MKLDVAHHGHEFQTECFSLSAFVVEAVCGHVVDCSADFAYVGGSCGKDTESAARP